MVILKLCKFTGTFVYFRILDMRVERVAYSSIMTNTTNKKVYRIPPIVIFGVLALLIYIFYGNDIGTFIMNYSGKGWGAK